MQRRSGLLASAMVGLFFLVGCGGGGNSGGDFFDSGPPPFKPPPVGSVDFISINRFGTKSGRRGSKRPRLSLNGNLVAFDSRADDLVNNDTRASQDVFLRNRSAASTVLISVNTAEVQANDVAFEPDISDNGNLIVFTSSATNMGGTPPGGTNQVYLRNISAGTTTLVSGGTTTLGGNGNSDQPRISGDGTVIVFRSAATDMVGSDSNGRDDCFRYVVAGGAISRISVMTDGSQSTGGDCTQPHVSKDGSRAVFASDSTDIVPGAAGTTTFQVYLRDQATGGSTTLVSATGGVANNGINTAPDISGNGALIVYESTATDQIGTDLDDLYDIYSYTVSGMVTGLISQELAVKGDGPSREPAVNDAGTIVVFESEADNWNFPPLFEVKNIWVHTISTAVVRALTATTDITTRFDCQLPDISGNGLYFIYFTKEEFDPLDTHSQDDTPTFRDDVYGSN